ncbi:hypothetical protein CCACVL1_12514 [Corchorus capsularis]|uniref:Uncharacterized protein n=1 Tax=Corchorus capsularis TaxID=210143 RepID=A0A1R3IF94_COCAP|nr:hypothetical protein CCACVL1_12514 [Corchorus capsularis]
MATVEARLRVRNPPKTIAAPLLNNRNGFGFIFKNKKEKESVIYFLTEISSNTFSV